jgi:hypothetical protein
MATVVTDDNEGLEAGALAGASLLLDWHDLHHFVLESRAKEEINNLVLLDGKGEEVDLFEAEDSALLYQASELCYGNPRAFLVLAPTRTTTRATTTAPATAKTTPTAIVATTIPAIPTATTVTTVTTIATIATTTSAT